MASFLDLLQKARQDQVRTQQAFSKPDRVSQTIDALKYLSQGNQRRDTFMINSINSIVGDISNIYDNSTLQNKKNILENRFGKNIASQSSEAQDMYNIKMAELDSAITKNAEFNSRLDYIDTYDTNMEQFFTDIQDRDLTQEDVLNFKSLQKEFIDNNTRLFEGNPYRMAKNPHLTTRINSLKDMSIYAIRNMEDLRMNKKEKNAFLNAITTDSLTPIDSMTKEQNQEITGIEKSITNDLKAYDKLVSDLNSDGKTVKIGEGEDTTYKTIPWTTQQFYQKTIEKDELEERIKSNNNRLSGYDRFYGQDYLRDIVGREFKKEDDRLDPTKYKTLDVLQNALDTKAINQDEFDKIAKLNKFDLDKSDKIDNKEDILSPSSDLNMNEIDVDLQNIKPWATPEVEKMQNKANKIIESIDSYSYKGVGSKSLSKLLGKEDSTISYNDIKKAESLYNSDLQLMEKLEKEHNDMKSFGIKKNDKRREDVRDKINALLRKWRGGGETFTNSLPKNKAPDFSPLGVISLVKMQLSSRQNKYNDLLGKIENIKMKAKK